MNTITKNQKADSRALTVGCSDSSINNCDPDYRGCVVINGHKAEVSRSAVFSGVLHYGIWGYTSISGAKEAFCGFAPAFMCEIP